MLTSILLLAPLAALAVDAPVTAVTVFSDRARVTRSATVPLAGTQRIDLPLVPDTVDPSTIRVEAAGGEVLRVDITHVDTSEVPADEARRLLAEIDRLGDEIAKVRGGREAALGLLRAVERITPSTPPVESGPGRTPVRLTPLGWSAVLAFAETWAERLQAKLVEADERLFTLGRERQRVVDEARLLTGDANGPNGTIASNDADDPNRPNRLRRRSGHRVSPTLAGRGPVRVSLTYMVSGARWVPIYDLALGADKGEKNVVQVGLAGLVSQESGEDWTDAALTLSTAIPATATTFEPLAAWKIGERERFIPTPTPLAVSAGPPPAGAPADAILDGKPQDQDRTKAQDRLARITREPEPAEENERLAEAKKPRLAEDEKGEKRDEDLESDKQAKEQRAKIQQQIEVKPIVGREYSAVLQSAPGVADSSAEVRITALSASTTSYSSWSLPAGPPPVVVGVGLAPPRAWVRPSYAPDLPAALAGGWDIAFPSLRPETVRSGQGARRVALASESWPVSVERRLFAALAPESFLVAEIRNPSRRALPGGRADLFVGADPAGTARLKLMAPGETFVLPLGIDRAVRAARNVQLLTSEKGLISKDEINRYEVTIEVANPYRTPIAARIFDQWPLAGAKDVQVELLEVAPAATRDEAKGTLEWRLALPPSGKASVRFSYSVRRPKSWKLVQD